VNNIVILDFYSPGIFQMYM